MTVSVAHPAPLPAAVAVTRVFLPFACGYFLSYLYRSVNAVIGQDLTTTLGLDAGVVGMLTSAYFLTFAASQLPLGFLLDRFGPRRIEATLLIVAAAGALVFGLADGIPGLVIGRALIGLGVSACLMASFKAHVLFFPRDKLPLFNGMILAAGGVGALSATAPVQAALTVTDWRGLFYALAALTLAVAVALFLAVPERHTALPSGGWRAQLRDTAQIYKSRLFWRVSPLPMVSQATFMSVQGLWAGPFLRDAIGLDRAAAATYLFTAAGAMVAGFLLLGAIAERLSRLGVKPVVVAGVGMTVFMVNQGMLTFGISGTGLTAWMVYGFFGTSGTLCYAALSQSFPPHLAGRVNTALNLLVFVAAFAIQWGMGAVIGLWPQDAAGAYPVAAYRTAFGIVLAMQAAAFVWFVLPRRKAQPDR